MISSAGKSFDILVINLNVLHNYFDSPIKLLLDLYPAKLLDASVKLFFLYCFKCLQTSTKKENMCLYLHLCVFVCVYAYVCMSKRFHREKERRVDTKTI